MQVFTVPVHQSSICHGEHARKFTSTQATIVKGNGHRRQLQLGWVGTDEQRETSDLVECNCCCSAFHGCRHHFPFSRLGSLRTHPDWRIM